jgi:hypothetical protein
LDLLKWPRGEEGFSAEDAEEEGEEFCRQEKARDGLVWKGFSGAHAGVDLGAEGEGMDVMDFGAGGGGAVGEGVGCCRSGGVGEIRERSWDRNCWRSAWVADQSV